MPLSKKYADALKRFDRDAQYTPAEALNLAKTLASAKFDETIEMVARLGVDPRKADQMVRGTVALPAGTGKTLRIAVFAAGEAAQAAREAGADMVGADDLYAEIEKGTSGQVGVDHAVRVVEGFLGLSANGEIGKGTVDFSNLRKSAISFDTLNSIHVPCRK